jgi:hypothetical protein
MKFSTKLSHAGIKLRHRFLKLRVQQPIYYRTLAVLVLIFAIGGMLVAYHFYVSDDDSIALGEQTKLEIQTSSINGEVASVNGNIIEVKTSIIETINGLNTVNYAQKKVQITLLTQISKIHISGDKLTRTPGELSDIKPGIMIAVYASGNTAQSSEIIAEKIEMIE